VSTFTYNIFTSYEPELGGYVAASNPSTSSDSPRDLLRGDWVTIAHKSSGHNNAITVTFPSTHFEGTLSHTLVDGQSATCKIKASSAFSQGSISSTIENKNARSYYSVKDSIDTYPDAFSIPDTSGANPNTVRTSNTFTVTGINSDAQATIGEEGKFRVNTGSFSTTAKTVNNNDNVTLQMLSSQEYGEARTATISIGGRSGSWTITNQSSPSSRIPFPIASGRIGIKALMDFYGGSGKLSDYIQGGLYVPNLSPENDNVSTTKASMKLSDYWGSATTLYFTNTPPDESFGRDTSNGGGTFALSTAKNSDFNLGFGTGMNNIVELRFTVVEIIAQAGGSASDISVDVTNGSLNTWSNNHLAVTSQVTVGGNTERRYTVKINIEARHPEYNSATAMSTVFHTFQFYGP
jgi:hypothetical protein